MSADGLVEVVEAALDDDQVGARADGVRARVAKETSEQRLACRLKPEPEKPATWTRPASRDGHDETGSSSPRPAE